jgi:6-pyruvoyltetrahydropterin/6-carboxytetrahydropterin synthase
LIVHIAGTINDTPGSPEEGMLKDFGFLKELMMKKVHDVLDHGFIIYEHDDELLYILDATPSASLMTAAWKIIRFCYVPTAENIARWAYQQLVVDINGEGFRLDHVEVWETPTSMAIYYGNDHATTE